MIETRLPSEVLVRNEARLACRLLGLALLGLSVIPAAAQPMGDGPGRDVCPGMLATAAAVARGGTIPNPEFAGLLFRRFLADCPQIGDVLRFTFNNPPVPGPTPAPTRLRYVEWPEWRQKDLSSIFVTLGANPNADISAFLRCPDPLDDPTPHRPPLDKARIKYSEDQAFRIFAAHVAHALLFEVREGATHWSLFRMTPSELEQLFDSYHYFSLLATPVTSRRGDTLDRTSPPRAMGAYEYMICDPRDGYRFITGTSSTIATSLLGTTQEETLGAISLFFANNVFHGKTELLGGPALEFEPREVARSAQVRDRLRGRHLPMTSFGDLGHAIIARSGCHSAANLLYDLARSVNIPLRVARRRNDAAVDWSAGDAALAFRWEDFSHMRVVQHADNFISEGDGGPYVPHWPTTPAGEPIADPGAEAIQYFEAIWRPASEFQARGMMFEPRMPVGLASDPTTTIEADAAIASVDPTQQQIGYLLATTTPRSFALPLQAELCTNAWLQRFYCNDTPATPATVRARIDAEIAETPGLLPTDPSASQLVDRVFACMATAGSCANAEAARVAFRPALGTRRWAD